MALALPPADDALAWLRRRTLWRAALAYARWVGRAVGWYFVVYVLFWLVAYLVSGVQLLAVIEQPLAAEGPRLVAPLLVALAALTPLLSGRVPPVVLGRRDLYRLGLAPLAPARALAWPLLAARSARALALAALGLVWSVLSWYWFAQPAPWAALAAGLLASLQLDLYWLRYAERQERSGPRYGRALAVATATLALVGLVWPGWGLGRGLVDASPWPLLALALLAALAALAVRRSLEQAYPPRFAAHSLVLSELRAGSGVVASLLGLPPVDPESRRRLLAQLQNRPPPSARRRLPPPGARWGALGALSWRQLLELYRRSWLSLAALALWLVVFSVLGLEFFGGVVGTLLHAAALAGLLSRLAGPPPSALPLPVGAFERTVGRTLPGAVLAAGVVASVLLGLVSAGLELSAAALLTLATQPLLGLVLLEKLAPWLGLSARRPETLGAAALLGLTPALLAAALGAAALAPALQLTLAWLLAQLPDGS